MRDHRITTALIIDPGIVETMTSEGLVLIDIPMLLINLGDEDTFPVEVYGRAAAKLIPNATYSIVEDAVHFSFLAQCKPNGAQILINENELAPLCDDAGGRSPADIHDELSVAIAAYLQAHT